MSLLRTLATVAAASLCTTLAVGSRRGEPFSATKPPPTASERYDELAPVLLQETAVNALTVGPDGSSASGNATFAFVVDTTGRVELPSIETLAATDSTTARALRRGLEQLRYIPRRIVLDVGRCVRVNGVRMHCGGATPAVRRLRARVVLHVEAFAAPPR